MSYLVAGAKNLASFVSWPRRAQEFYTEEFFARQLTRDFMDRGVMAHKEEQMFSQQLAHTFILQGMRVYVDAQAPAAATAIESGLPAHEGEQKSTTATTSATELLQRASRWSTLVAGAKNLVSFVPWSQRTGMEYMDKTFAQQLSRDWLQHGVTVYAQEQAISKQLARDFIAQGMAAHMDELNLPTENPEICSDIQDVAGATALLPASPQSSVFLLMSEAGIGFFREAHFAVEVPTLSPTAPPPPHPNHCTPHHCTLHHCTLTSTTAPLHSPPLHHCTTAPPTR